MLTEGRGASLYQALLDQIGDEEEAEEVIVTSQTGEAKAPVEPPLKSGEDERDAEQTEGAAEEPSTRIGPPIPAKPEETEQPPTSVIAAL